MEGSSFNGPITWKSILTSLMSKGMYCSTSHWIDSSSSSAVVVGSCTFLMITECPEREMATSFSWIFNSRRAVLIPSTTAPWSMIAPSTIASAGREKPELPETVLGAHRLDVGHLDGTRPDVQPNELFAAEQPHRRPRDPVAIPC